MQMPAMKWYNNGHQIVNYHNTFAISMRRNVYGDNTTQILPILLARFFNETILLFYWQLQMNTSNSLMYDFYELYTLGVSFIAAQKCIQMSIAE